ncbi:hypothetical protein EDC04DRAFT_2608948 [Pisolithus marmoratus]|nr:hypothetical protein EDC04DRAFT_2608948 [Pisolithus marmoratus]
MTPGHRSIVRDATSITRQCGTERLLLCAIRFRLQVGLPDEGEGILTTIAVLEGGVGMGMTEFMDAFTREFEGVSEGPEGLAGLGVEGGKDGVGLDEGGEDGEGVDGGGEGEGGEGVDGGAEQGVTGVEGGAELDGVGEDGLGVVVGGYASGVPDVWDMVSVEEVVGVVCVVCVVISGEDVLGVDE